MSEKLTKKISLGQRIFQRMYFELLKRHVYAITGPVRVLPDFIIIGAVRSGTTSLYHYLAEHPCISPSAYDELGFFDSNFHLGLNWYRSLFPTKFHKQSVINKEGQFRTYDVTPFYIWSKKTAERILETLPNVKLIALLRNPIDRAYSNYNLVLKGEVKLSFEEAIEREHTNLEKEKLNENDFSSTKGRQYYLSRGFYAKQLEIWFKLFSSNQIFVTSSEDLLSDANKTLSEMFKFLGLQKCNITNLKKRNVTKYPPMKPETRKFLVEYFKPHNEQLYKLIGKSFDWDK